MKKLSLALILLIIYLPTASAKDNKPKPISPSGGNNFQNCVLDGGSSSTNGNRITCCVALGDGVYKECTTCIKGTGWCRTSTIFDRYIKYKKGRRFKAPPTPGVKSPN